MAPSSLDQRAIPLTPKHLSVRIASRQQLDAFNRTHGLAVHLDVPGSAPPAISITGRQSETLSVWETRAVGGFVTRPRFVADLVTVRFVSRGQVVYRHRRGDLWGSPSHATLADFEGLREVRASDDLTTLSGSIALTTLHAAHEALTGGEAGSVPSLAPVADMSAPGMRALFCTMAHVHRQIREAGRAGDLVFPLVHELVSYQLLSAWPKRGVPGHHAGPGASSRSLGLALDHIQSNLTQPLTLSGIARTAGISVRALQDKFRQELGQTPVKYIIDQRLARAHDDLRSPGKTSLSIADIARRWGFVHISDFGQRYRRAYRQTPSQTRRDSA